MSLITEKLVRDQVILIVKGFSEKARAERDKSRELKRKKTKPPRLVIDP
jgi:hypothetical protein